MTRMRIPLTLGPGLLLALATASAASAQDIPSPYRYIETAHEAGIVAGVTTASRGRYELGPGQGVVLGARYAIELSGPFSLEAVARSISATRYVINPAGLTRDARIRGEADMLLGSADARVKFALNGRRTWNGLGPYVFAGGGLMMDLAEDPALDAQLLAEDRFDFGTSFVGILGAGTRWIPRDDIAVRLDAALDLWQLDTPAGYLDLTRDDLSEEFIPSPPPENEWVSAFALSLGLAYRW